MGWYVLFVETGKECKVKKYIEKNFDSSKVQCLIPRRKIPEKKQGITRHVMKTLYPGYVFIETTINFAMYYKLSIAPHTYKFLNYLNQRDKLRLSPAEEPEIAAARQADAQDQDREAAFFQQIPNDEMTTILNLLNDEGVIDYSKIYVEGSKVHVVSGPLKGNEGIIKQVDKHKNRAKILLSMIGNQILIDVGVELTRFF